MARLIEAGLTWLRLPSRKLLITYGARHSRVSCIVATVTSSIRYMLAGPIAAGPSAAVISPRAKKGVPMNGTPVSADARASTRNITPMMKTIIVASSQSSPSIISSAIMVRASKPRTNGMPPPRLHRRLFPLAERTRA